VAARGAQPGGLLSAVAADGSERYNADGSVCYRVLAVVETTAAGQTITTTYLDPGGQAVGDLKTVGSSTMATETATCNASPVPVPAYDPACYMIDLGECTMGACP
jgi:hypothetical protein